jgi:DNA-binding transcriptional ArsR family regulator
MSSETIRDYELGDRMVAATSGQLTALGDPLRLRICDLVLERAMSVNEIAGRVGRPAGSVAHHVAVLLDAGLLRVVRTRRVRAVEERFYGRVARTIVRPPTPGELPFVHDMLAEIDHERRARDRAGTVTFRHARLAPDRVAEFARRLEALAAEFVDAPRGGEVEFGLYVALYPTRPGR